MATSTPAIAPPPSSSALPPPPPDVTTQMGGTPQDPMQQAAMAGQQRPNPAGSALSKIELVMKVIQQVSRELPAFGPFGDRASQILKAGMAEAAGGSDNQAKGIMAPGSQTGTPSLRPPSGGEGMPG